MAEILDVVPVSVAARRAGVSYVWLKALIARGEVRTVRDRAGRLYLPAREMERLAARYERHRARGAALVR